MALEHVHEKTGYLFVDVDLLLSAFKPAQRNDEENIHDDGNRGLAAYGMTLMDMVKARKIVVLEQGTKKDVDSHVHWTRSKKGRAHACKVLGLDRYIDPSVRQQFEQPPATILAYILSAVFGAVCVDMESQKNSMSNTMEIMSQILRRIDAVVDETISYSVNDQTNVSDLGTHISTETTVLTKELTLTTSTTDLSNYLSVGPAVQEAFQSQNDALVDLVSNPFDATQIVPDLTWLDVDQVYDQDLDTVAISLGIPGRISDRAIISETQGEDETPDEGHQSRDDWSMATYGVSSNWTENRRMAVTPAKRKYPDDEGRVHHRMHLHEKLAHEEEAKINNLPEHFRHGLYRFLDHHQVAEVGRDASQAMHLRLLFLTIGSCQTLLTFKDTLRLARESPCSIHVPKNSMSVEDRLQAICRLDETQALCVTLRRCHTAMLFNTAREALRGKEAMTTNTLVTFDTEQRVKRGNPDSNFEASLTKAMMSNWMPGLEEGTKEYDKFRGQVTQLRRLAKILGIFTKAFGFGIIALLSSGPSYSEFNLTDTMLVSNGEGRLQQFVDVLLEQQGPFLKRLSRVVEPALTALINGDLPNANLFPIEYAEPRIFEHLPKGCHVVFEHLV